MPTQFVRALVLVTVLVPGLLLKAQAPTQVPVSQLLRVKDVDAGSVNTPQYDVSVRGMSIQRDGRRDWLMLFAEYETALEWTDEITVTFYVVLKGEAEDLPEGSKPLNLFSGTVTYMNVKKGNDHVATMFLDPNTFERYGKVEAVAVVFSINGQETGKTEPASNVKWWEREAPNAIPLLNRSESPWALIEMERHGTIKP
jgi:hypothetical protein